MKITTAMNHERRFLSRVGEILAWVRLGAHTHTWALEQRTKRIFDDPAWMRVPGWVRQKVNDRFGKGLRRMEMVIMYPSLFERMLDQVKKGTEVEPAAYVRWQLRVDGKHVTSYEICKRRAAGDEDIWNRVEGAAIWNHKPDRLYSDGWTDCSNNVKTKAS